MAGHYDGGRRPSGADAGRAARLARWIFALVLLAAFAAPQSGGAQELKVGETFQDWTSGCESAPESQNQTCFIFQKLTHQESGRELAAVAIGYAAQGGQSAGQPGGQPVAVITLPLGMLLTSGVLLKAENVEPKAYPVQFCRPDGCRSHIPMTPELLNAFKAGSSAEISFRDLARREVTLPISLLGFTKGLASLR